MKLNKIIDFKCSYENSIGINKEIIEKLSLKIPEIHTEWKSIAETSLKLKEYEKADFCELPFCHTLEGESMGGIITLGNENAGPRVKEYICESIEDVLSLKNIDYSQGRISEVLKACSYLRSIGENVAIYISGPFTILNMLIDPLHVFKAFKKKPEIIAEIFEKFQKELLRFIEHAQQAGANIISYGDPTGGVNILGPKLSEYVVDIFTYPFLKSAEKIIKDKSIFLLCPKTTLSLIGTSKANWKDMSIEYPIRYSSACIKMIGKTKLLGQMCVKNKNFELADGIIKTVELL